MARTTAPARWQRVQTLTPPAAACPPAGGSPIYDRLAQEWATAGRTLPGLPDMEWNRLAQLPPRYSRDEPERRPGPPPAHRGWLYDRHPA